MNDTAPDLSKQYAFKRGYRAALQKKRLTDMPSSVRQDAELRNLFEQGWQQAHEELQAGIHFNRTGYWRQRIAWIIMTALAGVATAFLIIDLTEFTPKTASTTLPAETKQNVPEAPQASDLPDLSTRPGAGTSNELSLLSLEERDSLSSTHIGHNYPLIQTQTPTKPYISATAQIKDVHSDQIFSTDEVIPKSTRKLELTIKFKQTPPQAVTLRWLWQRRLIQQQSLELNTPQLTSQQRMASGWQGEWQVEILDDSASVIYLYSFRYGHK